MASDKQSWLQSLAVYRQSRPRIMLFLGFSSGLPILLVFGTLSIWLRDAGVDRSTIGFVSWVALAYAFKWVWSPLVDRLPLPLFTSYLGRRRGWMLVSQLSVAVGLLIMASIDPANGLILMISMAVWVAFSSATQDIVIDAYRIEAAEPELQGAMAAAYMVGYRIAMIMASAGVLWIAAWMDLDEAVYQYSSWAVAYTVMAVLMGVGILTTLLIDEPRGYVDQATEESEAQGVSRLHRINWLPASLLPLLDWLWRAVISPFADFFRRYKWHALLLLALISSYRISDIVLGVIANVFYLDLGFSKAQIADVTKVFGIAMTLLGALVGGVLVTRFGVSNPSPPPTWLAAIISTPLARRFLSILHQITGFCGKPHCKRLLLQARYRRQNIRIAHQFNLHALLLFLDFFRRLLPWPIVRHRSTGHEDICLRHPGIHRRQHLFRRFHVYPVYSARCRLGHWPADQNDLRSLT